MISSNTRATRSRYSSPAAQGAQTPTPTATAAPALGWNSPLQLSKNSGNEGSKSVMERWLEPSLQSKPSFEEAGLARHGVLENMAPLGSLPKAKKNGGENGTASMRKIVHKASAAAKAAKRAKGASDSGTDTNESVGRRQASAPPAGRRSAAAKGADDDEDYNPKGNQRRRTARRASIPSAKITTDKDDSEQEVLAAHKSKRSPSVSKVLASTTRRLKTEDTTLATQKVIDVAVEEALKHYRHPTAWALRTLYDEKAGDEQFESMVTDVFTQAADEETLNEFARQVEEKKREGKRDDQSYHYFVQPPSTDSGFTAHKAKPARFGDLPMHQPDEAELKLDLDLDDKSEAGETSRKLGSGDETRAAKKAKTSHTAGDAPRKGAAATAATVGINDTVSTAAGTAEGAPGHAVGTGSHAAETAVRDAEDTKAAQTPSRKRRRRDSASSDSSLSSAMSLPSPEARRTSLSPLLRKGATSASTSAGARRNRPQDAPNKTARSSTRPQPITTTQGKSAADSTSGSGSGSEPTSPTTSLANTTKHHRAAHDSMPGRLAASELFPNLQEKGARVPKELANLAGGLKEAKEPRESPETVGSPMQDAELEAIFNRRRDAQRITNGYTAAESSVRGPRQRRDATPIRKTRKSRQSLATPYTTRTTRSATKKPNDDADTTVSPVALSFRGDDGSTTAGSRAVTPSAQKQGKKTKGLRVKSS